MADIPQLNYNIRQSSDRLQLQADTYNEEFVERLLLVMGHPDGGGLTTYGIVAQYNPEATIAGDGTPLSVSANATSPTAVDVAAGMVVTKSAMWAKLTNIAYEIPLADASIGIPNVVYMRYILDKANDEINDFNDPVSPYTMRIGSANSITPEDAQIDVDTLDVYSNYDASTTEDYVPLCVVTNQVVQDPLTGTSTTSLVFDFTRDNYSWNRPWFSALDQAHRALVGTGVVSATNPHGISQNDLTVGDFSPFQLLLDHGVIIADDYSVAKIPGVRCQVSIPYATLLTDTTGTKTTYLNAKYVELTNYPIRLGRVWIESSNIDWAALIVAETNRVVFPIAPPAGESIGMYFTKVQACEPPVGSNEIAFTTSNPTEGELVVAGGSGFTVLSNTQESFSDAQKIPMIYELFVDGEGSIIKTPRVIYCYKRLESIGTSDSFSIDLYGPGKIMMALADASTAVTMSVKIRLYGKDADDNAYDYLFEFTGSDWNDPGPIPRTDIERKAFRVSDKVFSSIDQIVVEERTSDGINSAIMMWVALNPYDTYDLLKDACHISEVMWDGLRFSETRDKRIINTTSRDFLGHQPSGSALSYMANVLAGGNETVYSENFLQPKYHDQIPNSARTGSLNDILPVNNIEKWRIGSYGHYRTRALPVGANPGTTWRVLLVPLQQTRADVYFTYLEPPAFYGYGSVSHTWSAVSMTAVPGILNTFQATLTEIPEMIKVRLNATDYEGMIIFG